MNNVHVIIDAHKTHMITIFSSIIIVGIITGCARGTDGDRDAVIFDNTDWAIAGMIDLSSTSSLVGSRVTWNNDEIHLLWGSLNLDVSKDITVKTTKKLNMVDVNLPVSVYQKPREDKFVNPYLAGSYKCEFSSINGIKVYCYFDHVELKAGSNVLNYPYMSNADDDTKDLSGSPKYYSHFAYDKEVEVLACSRNCMDGRIVLMKFQDGTLISRCLVRQKHLDGKGNGSGRGVYWRNEITVLSGWHTLFIKDVRPGTWGDNVRHELMDITNGKVLLLCRDSKIGSMNLSPDGKFLAVAYNDGKLKFFHWPLQKWD